MLYSYVILCCNMQNIYIDKEVRRTNSISQCNINSQTDHQAEQIIAIRIPGDLLCAVVVRCLMVGRLRTFCLCSNIIIPHGETSAIVSTLNKLKDLKCSVPRKSIFSVCPKVITQ